MAVTKTIKTRRRHLAVRSGEHWNSLCRTVGLSPEDRTRLEDASSINCQMCHRMAIGIARAAAESHQFKADVESLAILCDKLLESSTKRDLFFRRIVTVVLELGLIE